METPPHSAPLRLSVRGGGGGGAGADAARADAGARCCCWWRTVVERDVAALEAAHGVVVLFAAEVGSRVWGWADERSADCDVRLIFARPLAWFLSAGTGTDRHSDEVVDAEHAHPELRVVEGPDGALRLADASAQDGQVSGAAGARAPRVGLAVGLHGWHITKALRLLHASNPALLEWLRSPFVYRNHNDVRERLLELGTASLSLRTLSFSYVSIASKHWDECFKGRSDVYHKKYFYVLRALLATRVLPFPPMHIDDLLAAVCVSAEQRALVQRLLDAKRVGALGRGPRIDALDEWLEELFEEAHTRSAALTAEECARPSCASSAAFDALLFDVVMALEPTARTL